MRCVAGENIVFIVLVLVQKEKRKDSHANGHSLDLYEIREPFRIYGTAKFFCQTDHLCERYLSRFYLSREQFPRRLRAGWKFFRKTVSRKE